MMVDCDKKEYSKKAEAATSAPILLMTINDH